MKKLFKTFSQCLRISIICLGCIGLSACLPVQRPLRSPMEIREMQTREFQTSDTRLVMKAVLNVLQDQGFVTKNAVSDLGLITASKEVDSRSAGRDLVGAILLGPDGSWENSESIEATVNVSEFNMKTKVRVSFHRKVLDNKGVTMTATEVDDPLFYQQFLSKVDQSVFIQRHKI